MKRLTLIFCLLFLASGCVSRNIPIPDLAQRSGSKVTLKSISIKDRTPDPSVESKLKWGFLFGEIQQGITTQDIPFSKIVSKDIDAFFHKAPNSEYSLTVQIQTAEPYQTYPGLQRIPLLGVFAFAVDVEYGVYLRILFEVEQNNKVLRTYTYDNVIKTIGKNTTVTDIEEGYQKLIAAYRQEFFQQLDREFIERYF